MLLSHFINSCVKKVDFTASPAPDHKCVFVEIDMSKKKRGKGYWQTNTSILQEENDIKLIKDIIRVTNKNYKNHISARMLLDLIKFKIKENTIKYCLSKK